MEAIGTVIDLVKLNVFIALLVFCLLVLFMIRRAQSGSRMYIRPLAGYGKHAIDALVKEHFETVEGPAIEKADYEAEIRSSIIKRYGETTVERLFPEAHAQSRVKRRLQK